MTSRHIYFCHCGPNLTGLSQDHCYGLQTPFLASVPLLFSLFSKQNDPVNNMLLNKQ